MLTDAAIKALRPKEKLYKIVDRDGMYVVVQPSGAIVFRLDYRLNGRRETLTLGRYGPAGLSLARAREKVVDARRAISEGRSPAQEKQREKRRLQEAKSFGQFGERWLQEARMADSRALVYGCSGCSNSSSVGAFSTAWPRYMTRMWRQRKPTTARSCEIKR